MWRRNALATIASLAIVNSAHASVQYLDLASYLAAGNTLTTLDGYAPPNHTVAYPNGFVENGVTITGVNLTGVGATTLTEEYLSADGSMTLSFAPSAFAFYLSAPGLWRISISTAPGESFGFDAFRPGAVFVGNSAPGLDSITVTTLLGGPVNLLTTPPDAPLPEPSSLALLGVAVVGVMVTRRKKVRG